MDPTLINDAARAIHLVGLALGFGVAVLADVSASRALSRPLSLSEFETLERYHRMVTVGLFLLWGSGLCLLWLRTGMDPANFTPKLMTKLGVVCLLTLNAVLIGRIGLPTMLAWEGYRFGELPIVERLQLSALALLSGACWVSALALGVFSQLKTVSWDVLGHVTGLIYLAALSLAVISATLAPAVSFVARRTARQETA